MVGQALQKPSQLRGVDSDVGRDLGGELPHQLRRPPRRLPELESRWASAGDMFSDELSTAQLRESVIAVAPGADDFKAQCLSVGIRRAVDECLS